MIVCLLLAYLFLGCLAPAYGKGAVFVPRCTPLVDGVISPGEYPSLGHVRLARFYGNDQFADFYWCWDEAHLYLAGFLQDFYLYEDGPAENRWETWKDDSLEVYLHPDESSLPEKLNERSRVIAFTIRGTYWRVDRGEDGATVGLEGIREGDFGPSGRIRYFHRIYGEMNQAGSRNRGWSFELAIPWEILEVSPGDGLRLRFNLYWIRDDDGGEVSPRLEAGGILIDEWTVYQGDRYRPPEWEVLVLSGQVSTPPVFPQGNIEVVAIEGRRVRVRFPAPSRDEKGNPAFKYEVRVAEGATSIDEGNWWDIPSYPVALRPGTPGKEETIEILGLIPGRTYTVALRALNEKGLPSRILTTSFTTPAEDSVFVAVSPRGRTLVLTDGSPFTMVPEAAMIPWLNLRGLYDGLVYDPYLGRYRNYYEEEGPEEAETYLRELARNGINTLLVGVESLDRKIFFEPSPGVFNEAVFSFLDRLIALCRIYNIRLLVRIYDTYYYRTEWDRTPWYRLGKTSPDQFFDPDLYPYHERRLAALLDQYRNEPMILGWEILNEVDNAERFNQATLEARRTWLEHMLRFAREHDPHHLLFFTFITWDPKDDDGHYRSVLGIDAATAYRISGAQLAVPHAYYPNIRDPHDPVSGPMEMSRGIAYAFYRVRDGRPVLDGESGPSPLYITAYRADFTPEDDLLFFTRNLWLHFVSGGAGAPVRWPGEMFSDTNTISPEMRRRLALFSRLVENIAWRGEKLKITRRTKGPLTAVGRSDGRYLVAYFLNQGTSSLNEIPWPAESGPWHVKVYSPFDGSLLYETSGWIEERLSLPSPVSRDMVLIAEKTSPVRLHTERREYRANEPIKIFLDLAPFQGEDVWLWAEVNGEKFYIASLNPLQVSSSPAPLDLSFDLPFLVANFPLFDLPSLLPGNYCLGMKVGDFEDQLCWEVLQ